MVRIAERIAERVGAHALVTGDAVGQVASQTVDNLAVVGSVATLPILRPLVGMDKEEITAGRSAHRDLSDVDRRGRGLLHAVYAAVSGDPRVARGS